MAQGSFAEGSRAKLRSHCGRSPSTLNHFPVDSCPRPRPVHIDPSFGEEKGNQPAFLTDKTTNLPLRVLEEEFAEDLPVGDVDGRLEQPRRELFSRVEEALHRNAERSDEHHQHRHEQAQVTELKSLGFH